MTIAYINADPGVPVFGTDGPAVHVQEVLRAWLKRGACAHLFANRFGALTAEFSGLRISSLPLPAKTANPLAREKLLLDANESLRTQLESSSPGEQFDLIYERYSIWSFAAMEFARERNIPAVLEVNAPLIEEQSSHRALIDRTAAEEATMRAFRAATVITAVSKELAHMISQHPSAQGKVLVVPNAADPARFDGAAPAFPRKPDEFVIGFVGTLKPWQGLTTLVEAFGIVANQSSAARLMIVGDGPEREYLDREMASRGLSGRVRFCGAVPPHAIPGLLASMDVALAPFPPLTKFYFSPIKVFEYMAAGLPVVASRIGQVGDIIRHGVTGMLVPPGNAVAIVDALTRLEGEPELRAALGAAARHYVSTHHTWDGALDRVLASIPVAGGTAATH